eukprot:5341739-Prymnesium_polylepis.2
MALHSCMRVVALADLETNVDLEAAVTKGVSRRIVPLSDLGAVNLNLSPLARPAPKAEDEASRP